MLPQAINDVVRNVIVENIAVSHHPDAQMGIQIGGRLIGPPSPEAPDAGKLFVSFRSTQLPLHSVTGKTVLAAHGRPEGSPHSAAAPAQPAACLHERAHRCPAVFLPVDLGGNNLFGLQIKPAAQHGRQADMFGTVIAVAVLAHQGGDKEVIHPLLQQLQGVRKGQLDGNTGFISGADGEPLHCPRCCRAGENCLAAQRIQKGLVKGQVVIIGERPWDSHPHFVAPMSRKNHSLFSPIWRPVIPPM